MHALARHQVAIPPTAHDELIGSATSVHFRVGKKDKAQATRSLWTIGCYARSPYINYKRQPPPPPGALSCPQRRRDEDDHVATHEKHLHLTLRGLQDARVYKLWVR
jgi:hypothetical protein